MRSFVVFCAVLGAVSASILAPVDRLRCRAAGTRCAGAPGHSSVPWISCCDGECSEDKVGEWGKFCPTRRGYHGGTEARETCRAAGSRCAGSPGFPAVPWLPCCDGDCSVTKSNTWGKFCSSEDTELKPSPQTSAFPPVNSTVPAAETPSTGTDTETNVTPKPPSVGTASTTTTTETFTATTASTVTDATKKPTTGGTCEGLDGKPRPDAASISQNNWDLFVSGVNALKEKPSTRYPGMSVLDEFSRLHNEIKPHFGAIFLVWHRVMLWEFEKELNAVSPGCRIPVYDWAREVPKNNVLTSSLFQEDRAGGSAPYEEGRPKPIVGGSFEGLAMKTAQTDGEVLVTRNFNPRVLPKDSVEISTQLSAYSTYKEFGAWLEGVHGPFHVAVGGIMNSFPFSPSEPRYASQDGCLFFRQCAPIEYAEN